MIIITEERDVQGQLGNFSLKNVDFPKQRKEIKQKTRLPPLWETAAPPLPYKNPRLPPQAPPQTLVSPIYIDIVSSHHSSKY